MENKRFEIAFTSKEGNKVSLSINSSWLIYTANAADFKKAIKEYFVNDANTDKINDYIDFIREKLETWNKTENGNNKTVKSKLAALDMFSGKKSTKKSDFEKAANIILKNAKKECTNTRAHNAYIENNNLYVTDSHVVIRTNNRAMYNGFIAENGLNLEQLFNSFSANNDICKVFIPDIETVKANQAKGKNESYFVTFDHTAYNVNLLYTAMLAVSFDSTKNCYAYKRENNALSLLYLENTENNTSALIMPIKPRENGLINAVEDNMNAIISCNGNYNVLGISYFADIPEEKEDPVLLEETETKTENNNSVVMEYIKNHVVIPVTLETIENDNNYKQMVHILSDTDNITGFIKVYRYNYDTLYNNPDTEKQNNIYMYAAESFMKEYPHMHISVSEQMKDMFISDRELIAYGMTLKMFSFDLDRYGYELDNPIIKIQGIELYKNDIENAINNKRYLIKGHCVYMIMRTKTGYKAHRIYKSNDDVPLLKKNCYSLWDRESTERLINRAIIPYPA